MFRLKSFLLTATAMVFAGCSAPGAQLARCQAEKDELLAILQSEKTANRSMQEKLASLESRLDESEKHLARAPGSQTRVSTRLETGAPVRAPASQQGESDSLPWRQHRKDRDSQPTKPTGPKLSAAQSSGSGDLAALARRDSRLNYDEQSGVAQVDLEIPFESGSARLNEDGRKALDDLAKWLRSSPAAELRVMVAGYAEGKQAAQIGDGKKNFANSRQLGTARAQAVADYLDRHGISEDRLGVTGAGSRAPHLASSDSRHAAESVQIYVAEPDAMLVGWAPVGTLR